MITEEIIKEAQAGNSQAFATIYDETVRTAYYVAKRILLDDAATEDVLQESYIAVYNHLSDFKTGNLQGWVDTIVANRAKNYLRRKNPILFSEMETEEKPVVEFEEEKIEFRPDEKVDYDETQRLVLEIVDNLSPEQRLSIMLFYFEDKSVKEIAEICQCSENTVKSRLNYARKKIKEDVLELEKKGTKLYSAPIIPFIIWMLSKKAKACQVPQGMSAKVLSGVNSVVNSTMPPTGGSMGNWNGNTVTTMVAGKTGMAIGAKIAIAAVVGSLVIGGTAAGIAIAYHISSQESEADDSFYKNISQVEGPKAEENIVVKVGNVNIPITSTWEELVAICEKNNWTIEDSLYPDESGWSSKPYNQKGSIITPKGELLVCIMPNEENNGAVIEYICISPFYYEGAASVLGVTTSTRLKEIEAKFEFIEEDNIHRRYAVDKYVELKIKEDSYEGKNAVTIQRTPYSKR